MDADLQDQSLHGLEGFQDFEDGPADDGMDADFGTLEMFDSNAVAAPFSTQSHDLHSEAPGQAPDAVMTADAPSSPSKSKKSKRDKKNKQKQDTHQFDAPSDTPPREEGRHTKAKFGAVAETSAAADALTSLATAAEPLAHITDAAEGHAAQQKRKRKSEGGTEKRRKKKKHAEEGSSDPIPTDTQDENGEASGFLHKHDDDADITAIANEDASGSNPQGSPIVDHLSRQNHSGANTPDRLMDDGSLPGFATTGADVGIDVGRLAEDAFHFHAQTQDDAPPDGEQEDTEMANAEQEDVAESTYATPPEIDADPEPPASSGRPKRTRAKKAKPTYYEQPPEEPENDGDYPDLPSPSAMTPKPRQRTKAAAKKAKTGRARKSSPDDDDDEKPAGRRDRMAGFVQGRFSDIELERIARAVHLFRDERDLEQTEVNDMIHAAGGTNAGEAHAQLWSRLFAECPDRHRQKVINITRKKFHNFVARGTWTKEQESELRDLIDMHGQKWSKIASLINRHPEDIRDRFRNYVVCGTSQKKDAWVQEEESRLSQYVIEAMRAIDDLRVEQPSRELLRKPYEELIDWQNISERMDRTRSRLQCITKWKSMNLKLHGSDKLASLQPDSQISFNLERARRQIAAMPEEERYRLVMAIRNTAVGIDAKIPWQKLLDKPFRNEWHRATQVLLWHRLKRQVPQWEAKSVRDSAQYLIDQYNQTRELPDVDGDDWDDAEEMQCVASAFASSQSKKTPKKKTEKTDTEPKSAEYVAEEDDEAEGDEDGEGELEQEQEAQDAVQSDGQALPADQSVNALEDDGMQIDPALTQEPDMDSLPLGNAPQSSPLARKTPKMTYGKRRGSAKKGAMLSQDPIEDDDEMPPPGQQQAVTTPAKRRAKGAAGKFKTPTTKTKEQDAPANTSPAVSSDMDDMDDLPARAAA